MRKLLSELSCNVNFCFVWIVQTRQLECFCEGSYKMTFSKNQTFAFSQSSQTVVVCTPKKQYIQHICSSEPFLKPKLTLLKILKECKNILLHPVLKFPQQKNKNKIFQLTDTTSLNESKCILRSQANDLNRLKQLVKHSENAEHDRCLRNVAKASYSQQVTLCKTKEKLDEWQLAKSAVKITLDPKTANPSLKTSSDQRQVRSLTFEESKKKQHAWLQRDLHKYDGWYCIQGTEGFTSGQYYWEVDVKGCCDWRIGVVKESAPRHGFTKLTTSTGYWTLRLQLGNLIALTEPVTKLNRPSPTRVGVYLDIEGREVRFFDAKKRQHIYTFKADFDNSEKIYPVFGTVETDQQLTIRWRK